MTHRCPSAPAHRLDVDAPIKARQHGTWSSGDYAAIGTTLQLTGELLCEAVDVGAGERVLDVAAGNGNAALAAARRGGVVTASRLRRPAPRPHRRPGRGRRRGDRARPADAEDLPFDDGTFDVVLSTFGVMFTPQPEVAAAELLRVCRPGGRIGLANWTPAGFVGQMFKLVGRYVPPPAGLRSPLEWGEPARLDELFGGGVSALTVTPRRSCSATARPGTGSTRSAPSTARCSRRSPRSTPTVATRSTAS